MALGQLAGYRLLGPFSGDDVVTSAHAHRESDGAEVTVHVVVAKLSRGERQQLRTEAAVLDGALAEMNNPFVVPLLDHGSTPDGRLYLVTGPQGPSLADELVRGPLPADDVRQAAQAAAAGLELLHREGIVHQGVRPAALLRQSTGKVVLCSPLPSLLVALIDATTDGTGHEPPELLSTGDWTPAGEVFALASTVWTLLTGKAPFPGSRHERLVALLGGDPPELSRIAAPDGWAEALASALAPEPGNRPGSVAAFATRLTGRGPDPRQTTPTAELMTIRKVGGYELQGQVGSGSTGTVWRARRVADGGEVALKLLHAALATDPDTLMRLVRERSAVCNLAHPHLVRVLDLVMENGETGLVMEFVDGPDLRQLLNRGEVGGAEAARLLSEAASGLADMHDKRVLHRDVKPANILVRKRGGVRRAALTDFGLAKGVGDPTVTRAGQVLGTPCYLAPELIRGGEPTTAADVYALGVTAYEALSRYRPFDGETTEAVYRQHLTAVPRRPADLPDQAWELLRACLDKDFRRRPSALETADELSALAAVIALDGPERLARIEDGPTGAVSTPSSPPWHDNAPVPLVRTVETPTDEIPMPVLPPWHDDPPLDSPVSVQLETLPPATLRTEASDRPLESAPPEKPARRRRRGPLLVAAVAVVAAIGGFVGWWSPWRTAHPDTSGPATTTPQTGVGAAYRLQTTITKNADGGVTLSWPAAAEKLAGLDSYLVMRGSELRDRVPKGTTDYRDPDPGGSGCYFVIAYNVTEPPPSPAPLPACP